MVHACVPVCVCTGSDAHGLAVIAAFLFFVQCMHFFGYFVNSVPVRMCIYTANCLVPQHCADLC